MGVIFPLSIPAKVALILIAVFIGLIWSYFAFPGWWRKFYQDREAKRQARLAEKELVSKAKDAKLDVKLSDRKK